MICTNLTCWLIFEDDVFLSFLVSLVIVTCTVNLSFYPLPADSFLRNSLFLVLLALLATQECEPSVPLCEGMSLVLGSLPSVTEHSRTWPLFYRTWMCPTNLMIYLWSNFYPSGNFLDAPTILALMTLCLLVTSLQNQLSIFLFQVWSFYPSTRENVSFRKSSIKTNSYFPETIRILLSTFTM